MSRRQAVADGGPLHRLDARAKLLACVGFVVITVSIPSADHVRLAGCAGGVAVVAVLARLHPADLGRRVLHLLPFLAMAAVLPFTRPGGLDQAVGEAAKALIGCAALVVLAATTPAERLLAGLAGLRCPAVIILVLSLMLRYVAVLIDEAGRMRRAALARGWRPRSLLQATTVGNLIGALFLRSQARAERVHAAMCARGYDGTAAPVPPEPVVLRDVAIAAAAILAVLVWRFLP